MISLFCNHDWKILLNQVSESELEHCKRLGFQPKSASAVRRQTIMVSCNKCGKLKVHKNRL
jgi:predicted SprT family Zn-dependent metalloprotease